MTVTLTQIGLAIFILATVFGASELGFRFGRRFRKQKDVHFPLGAVQGGSLGLLGLLLGFAFAGASARFLERQDILTAEANAIGTAYLRADLLPPATGDIVRQELRGYLQDRLTLFAEVNRDKSAQLSENLEARHSAMWSAAVEAVRENPPLAGLVLPPLNDVIDLLAARNAAALRHLPIPVLGLLIASAAISMTVIGYGAGATGSRHISIVGALGLLIAVSLWVTIDLDHPRIGLIRVNAQSLTDLAASIESGSIGGAQRRPTPEPPPVH